MLLLIFHKKVIALRLGHSTEPQSYNNCRIGQRRGGKKKRKPHCRAPALLSIKKPYPCWGISNTKFVNPS